MEQQDSRKRKVFLTMAVVSVFGGLGAFGTFAAFTATTANSGNRIEAGSVSIGDSDAGTGKLYDALNQGPGASPTPKCIRVTYSGSLASAVKVYRSAVTNGADFRLKVERGSGITTPGSDMNCTGFTASSTAFDAGLDTFPATYAGGIDGKASGAAWAATDTVDYRFTISVVDDPTANAHTSKNDSGAHSFTWEAQSN